MNALASMTEPSLSPNTAAGEVVALPSILLSGFDELLGEAATELLAESKPVPADNTPADVEADGRHVFFAAFGVTQDASPPLASHRQGNLSVDGEGPMLGEGTPPVVAEAPEVAMDPWGLGDVVTLDVADTMDGDVDVQPSHAPSDPVRPNEDEAADSAKATLDNTTSDDREAPVQGAASLDESEVQESEPEPAHVTLAKVETASSSASEIIMEDVRVDVEDVVTPELSADLPAENTVRVQVDDDLAVEVSEVDGEVDVALLGSDAVKPVMKTVEGEIRDALKRGGYDLGHFDRDEQDAPRERRRRQGSKNPNTPERRAHRGVLL